MKIILSLLLLTSGTARALPLRYSVLSATQAYTAQHNYVGVRLGVFNNNPQFGLDVSSDTKISGSLGVGVNPGTHSITTNGQINAVNGFCMNGDCKANWFDVALGTTSIGPVITTTDAIVAADIDNDGSGVISFRTGVSTKAYISNDGKFNLFGEFIGSSVTLSEQLTAQDIIINNDLEVFGNVGIATGTPVELLHINAGVNQGVVIGPTAGIDPMGGGELGIVIKSSDTSIDAHIVSVMGDDPRMFLRLTTPNIPWTFGAGNAERMRLTSAGNFGIGTTLPSAKLDIDPGSSGGLAARIFNNSNGGFNFKLNNGVDVLGFGVNFMHGITMDTGESIAFSVGGSTTPNLVIRSGGNVGIGTVNPMSLLDVAGRIKSTSIETSSITSTGIIQSSSGGFKFPDGTIQTSSAPASASAIGLVDRVSLIGQVGSYLDVVNSTSSGRLRGVSFFPSDGVCGASAALRITIDNSSVETLSLTPVSAVSQLKPASGDSALKFQITLGVDDPAQNLDIFFKSYLRVEYNGDTCGGTSQVIVEYERE